jgi:hypothetical protein
LKIDGAASTGSRGMYNDTQGTQLLFFLSKLRFNQMIEFDFGDFKQYDLAFLLNEQKHAVPHTKV